MAKDKLDFKNLEEIDEAKQKVRGERLLSKDKEILPEPVLEDTEFGKPDKIDLQDEFVELHVYDNGGNLLESVYENIEWTVKKAPGGNKTQGQQLQLKPGHDLRTAGYRVGKFKLVYNFFSELLGTRLGNKVYIEEISPTRKEIRILPVRKHPKASLDPNKKPFIKNLTAYDGLTKFDENIKGHERGIEHFDKQISILQKKLDRQSSLNDHWQSQGKTFALTGNVQLTNLRPNGTQTPYSSGHDEYPNQRFSSLETHNIIDGRINAIEGRIKEFNTKMRALKDRLVKPTEIKDRLTKWQEKTKYLHRDDKQFFYDFYDFTQGNDTDEYTYSEGNVKSSGFLRHPNVKSSAEIHKNISQKVCKNPE